jgi:hypothetical protein
VETIEFIKKEKPELMAEVEAKKAEFQSDNFTDVDFDDLNNK